MSRLQPAFPAGMNTIILTRAIALVCKLNDEPANTCSYDLRKLK